MKPDRDGDPGMLPDSYFRGWHRRRYQLEHWLRSPIGTATVSLVGSALGAVVGVLLSRWLA